MLVLSILSSLVMIFILIIPGFIFRKKSILSDSQNDGINNLVINLTWPCLVIDAMQITYDTQILKDSAYIFIVCIIVIGLLLVISFPFAKLIRLDHTKQYLTVFMLMFGNTGFIGIPVIKALYGKEAIFYAAIIELVNDILIFTVGIIIIQMAAKSNLKIGFKEFLSPGLIGVLVGFILFILKIQLPELLGGSISMIGAATTPLTMFVIGYQVAGLKGKEIVGEWKVYAICAARLLILPICCLMAMRLFVSDFSLLEKVLIIDFAMPVAAVSAIFAKQYHTSPDFATKSVLLSTILSLITIPIFAILMEL